MRYVRITSIALLAWICLGASARGGIIFDNFDADTGYGYANGGTGSGPFGFGVYFSTVTNDTPITNIQVRTNINSPENLTFLIFDDASGNLLYQSLPKHFAADAFGQYSWKRSDDFAFTLVAGHQYDIGYEGDGISQISSQDTPHTQNGLTSSTNPVVFSNGTRDRVAQQFNSDYHIILEGPAATAVPEPATMTLLGFAVAGLAGYGWRRHRHGIPRRTA